jgi:hypothetical protein
MERSVLKVAEYRFGPVKPNPTELERGRLCNNTAGIAMLQSCLVDFMLRHASLWTDKKTRCT